MEQKPHTLPERIDRANALMSWSEIYSRAGNLWSRTLEMFGGMIPGALERILPRRFMLKTLSVYAYGTHVTVVRVV